MKERVQKLMAQANLGSRRACEDLIRQGRVRVNGAVIQLGDKADGSIDTIEVDGERLKFAERKIYIALNKPKNVLSTNVGRHDDRRRTIRSFVPMEEHLFTIGRLDADSEGLIVLTNDGELTNRLTHPRYQHTKTYNVVVYGMPDAEALKKWEEGVYLEDGRTARCSVSFVKYDGGLTTLLIVMTEGKKRQIRRVASSLGYPVRHLIRTHIGSLGLGELQPGEWRELTSEEVEALRTSDTGLTVERQERRPRRPVSPRGSKQVTQSKRTRYDMNKRPGRHKK